MKLLCCIDNLAHNIDFIDFTNDNCYLLYKDINDEVAIIDLNNLKKMSNLTLGEGVEWCSDGIKVSE